MKTETVSRQRNTAISERIVQTELMRNPVRLSAILKRTNVGGRIIRLAITLTGHVIRAGHPPLIRGPVSIIPLELEQVKSGLNMYYLDTDTWHSE